MSVEVETSKDVFENKLAVDPPKYDGVKSAIWHVTLDGTGQGPVEQPPLEPLVLNLSHGQTVEATVQFQGVNGVLGKLNEPLKFTAIDDVEPETPSQAKLVAKSKKLSAAH